MKTHLASEWRVISFAVLVGSLPWAQGQVYYWSTVAGSSTGYADGTNDNAKFDNPAGLVVDSAGNIFVTDQGNVAIREVTPMGTNWVVTTIAGNVGHAGFANGSNNAAQFFNPLGITVDSNGILFVADRNNNSVRKIAPVGTNWVVSTIAGSTSAGNRDGTNTYARFTNPNGIGIDGNGTLYVAAGDNETVRRIIRSGTNWVTQTVAGSGVTGSTDGTNLTTQFYYPSGAAPDANGNVYVTDQRNYTIRKLTPDGTNWVVSTIAGMARSSDHADGTNSDARFYNPGGLAVDLGGNIYVADLSNHEIRKITPAGTNWIVSTIGGLYGASGGFTNGTLGSSSRFIMPNGVALDYHGNVYVVDETPGAIRRGTPLPVAQPIAATNNTLTLTWSAAVGQLLQVQYTTDLARNNWSNLGDQFVCTNCTVTVPDSVASVAQRFYRVIVTP